MKSTRATVFLYPTKIPMTSLDYLPRTDCRMTDSHRANFSPSSTGTASATVVSGAIGGVNEYGDGGIYFADSGLEQATTDLYKLKLFYDLDNIQLRGSVAMKSASAYKIKVKLSP